MSDYIINQISYSNYDADCQRPELDKLECIVFSKSPGTMAIRVEKGCTPNWFHRKMQELIFGVKWRTVRD